MLRRLGIMAFCVSTLVGCTEGLFTGTADDKKKTTGDDDEAADPPQNVNASYYMACQFINQAQESRPEAELGCVVREKETSKKLVTTEIAEYVDWDYEITPEEQQGVVIGIQDLKDSNTDFHVLYSFAGSNAAVVNQVANNTYIAADVKPLNSKPRTTWFSAKVSAATQSQVSSTPQSEGIFGNLGDDPLATPGN